MVTRCLIGLLCTATALVLGASAAGQAQQEASALPRVTQVLNGRAEQVTHRGVAAVRLIATPESAGSDGDMLGMLDNPEFTNGTIQVDVAGSPRPGAPADSRGFIGLSFRTGKKGEWTEVFYLRPTNGRADDQLRRNHAVQYDSHPDYPWYRLRSESPGVYESYADLVPDEWTTMKIVVNGTTARLYLNGAAQPCLVVTDLKHGALGGRIALWAHVDTDAYFSRLSVSPR